MSGGTQESLAALSGAISSGRQSSTAATTAVLARIGELDGRFGCFISVDADGAMAAAELADREIAAGVRRGPLHGVPIACKDIFDRAGRCTSAGTKPLGPPAAETSTVVERLQAGGAVIVGALNMDELAAGGTGINEHFGRCANPRSPAHIAGGSSSGSAASVAAGFVPASLGSDAGGSIRLPAAFCGVVGLKPTYGRVSRHGTAPRSWSMDSTGPLARDALDCAILLGAIAGADPRDPSAAAMPVPDYAALATDCLNLRGTTIGIASGGIFAEIDAEVAAALGEAVERFRSLGAKIVPVEIPDLPLLNDLQQILVKCEAAAIHGARLRADPDGIGFSARSVIQEGLLIPATRYIEALALRGPLLRAHVESLYGGNIDIVFAPVTAGPAPLASIMSNADAAAVETLFTRTARFTRFANYLGTPAISVPCGSSTLGLPLAFQLLGPPFAEAKILSSANAYLRAVNP